MESMTKKGHQKFWALKWKFFLKKVIRKFGQRNLFSVPPNSASSLRPCSHPVTVLLEIFGGRMHRPSPPQILGNRPPSPPKSPPMPTVYAFEIWTTTERER